MDPTLIDTGLTGILIYIVWRGMDAINVSIAALRQAMQQGYDGFNVVSKKNGEQIAKNSEVLRILETRTRKLEEVPKSRYNGQ